MRFIKLVVVIACVLLQASRLSTAQTPNASTNGQYLVEFRGSGLPNDLSARVAALGGKVVDTFPEINVAIVANMTESAATSLRAQSDVDDVTTDELTPMREPGRRGLADPYRGMSGPMSAADPTAAHAFAYQWNMRAISADRAWRAGYVGSPDVRIAVIDTGVDPSYPDLAPLIDTSRSRSFCPNENSLVQQEFPGYPSWTDLYGHGTYVASIAASNGQLVAGVTSRSKLMAIKALGITPCGGSAIFNSILFAADKGADVINMSLGNEAPTPRAGQKGTLHYWHLAVQYALVKGVSAVVVAAGNSGIDLDHNGNGLQLLCDVPGVICVSATGPIDSGPDLLGPFVDVDAPAFYSNFGSSAINVAAPGGGAVLDNSGNLVSAGWIFGACASTDRAFDVDGHLVPGLCSSGGFQYSIAVGTSASAPHVSGLAALLVSKFGHGHPAQVRAAIENSADDLGKPGADPFYGKGRINVARALGLP